jgi:hypothetical protein
MTCETCQKVRGWVRAIVRLPETPRYYGVRVYRAGSDDAWATEEIFSSFDAALNKTHELNQGATDGSWFVTKERGD